MARREEGDQFFKMFAAASSATTTTNNNKETKSSSIFLQIIDHQDGTITRPSVPVVPPNFADDDTNSPVLFRDLPLNPSLHTSLRLYLPNPPPSPGTKLPIVVYYHGGGFVLFRPDFALYHQFCHQMSLSLPALVVSLDYRLAPEHPLPAAYQDAVEAVMWVRDCTDPWIVNHGDLSRCFLAGSSSGGNMGYFAGLRLANLDLGPVNLRGLVLIQPYFGGERRTESEIKSEEDDILPLRANEMMWRMALPKGADRDHEFCNPMVDDHHREQLTSAVLPKTMVIGCKGDPLFDRQREFVKMMEEAGNVSFVDGLEEEEKGHHAIELFDADKAQAMFAQIRSFISTC